MRLSSRRSWAACVSFAASTLFATSAADARSPGVGTWRRNITITGKVNGVTGSGKINIFLPKGYTSNRKQSMKLLVALHGWRGRGDDWERNAPIEYYADRGGYVIVAPHLGTTVHERSYFPETSDKHKWGAIPGGRWVGEVVVPYMRRNYNVSKTRMGTAIMGLSTGGRGAALLPAYYPRMFGAFAALSGDYDITMAPKEKTCTYIYGPYEKFSERWKADNSKYLLGRLKGIPALLIHGKRDKVCPVDQSRLFARDMKAKGFDVTFIEDPVLGHDWRLWGGYLGAVFEFFNGKLRAAP